MAERSRLEVDVFKVVRIPIPPSFLRTLLQRTASTPEVAARMPDGIATVAVRLTTDEELRHLNHDFAGHDEVTDVLSFTGSEQHLGDLAVSWPAAVRQARQFGHPEQSEVGLLCVHGLLHLAGWDHESSAEQKEMTRLTVAALASSGVRLAPGRL
ncbi:MAG: rRNA maturation RNase YbeY [Candidatus Dormibacteraceae bacterium]